MNANTEVSKQAAHAARRLIYREKQQEQDKVFAFDLLLYLKDQDDKLGTSECVTGCVYVEYLENGWRLIDRADWLSAGPEVELALIGKDTAEEVAVEEIREALSRVRTFQSIVRPESARIGDRVFYYTRKGDRWSDPKIPYNTTGTVVGREKYSFFVDMLDSKHVYDGNPTGKYESDNGQLIINWDLPEQPKESIGACDLGFVDAALWLCEGKA